MRPSSFNSLQKKKQRQPTIGSTTNQNEHIANAPPLQTSTIQRAQLAPRALPTGDILALQRTMGNRQVAQMLDSHHSIQRAPTSEVGTEAGTDIGLAGGEVDGAQARKIHAPQGGGQPVPKDVRSRVEAQSGTDLGAVRVYHNKDSHTLNRQLNSKAFTHQNNIFLGKNESPHDVQLMAHELTHTIQQTGGQQTGGQQTGGQKVQRQGNKSQITPHPAKGEAGIQRKVENLHLDKRLRRSYSKRINNSIKEIRQQIKQYNAIPMNDTDYDNQIELLDDIRIRAAYAYRVIGTNHFMNGSVRKLGGPFRLAYYMLQRNLYFLGMGLNSFTMQERDRVETQKRAAQNVDPVTEARNRSVKHQKNGGNKTDDPSQKKYDFRELEKASKEKALRTFKIPLTVSSIPGYNLNGELLADSMSPGNTVVGTGIAVRIQLQASDLKHREMAPGRVILMYEIIKNGIMMLIPASLWDREMGANTYTRHKTPKDAKGFDYWLSTWDYSDSHQRTDDKQKRSLKQLNGIGLTHNESLQPEHLDITDELHLEGGFSLLKDTPKQNSENLDSSTLQIPRDLENEGGLTLLDAEENLDPSSLEIPEDLQKERGFSLL